MEVEGNLCAEGVHFDLAQWKVGQPSFEASRDNAHGQHIVTIKYIVTF